MHFRAGSSECWRWGWPPRESWEHSPEQGNLGRKTRAWEVLTLTVQASQTPPPPPLPQKLLRPTPHSQQPALSARPRRFVAAAARAHAPLSAKGRCLSPFPAHAHTHPGLQLASTSRAPPPLLSLSPQHPTALSFLPFQPTSPHQPRCPQGPTLAPCRLLSRFLANGLYWTPQSSTTRGPLLFNMSRSSSAEPVADGRKFKESWSRLNRQLSEARCRYRALQPPRGWPPTKASPPPPRLAGVRRAALFSSLLSLPPP